MKNLNEIISETAAEQFSKILQDAITDYSENKETMPVKDWLHGYLNRELTERSAEEIQSICGEIIGTVNRHNEKIKLMNEALANGKSAENWFVNDVMSSGGSPGVIAKETIACDAALNVIIGNAEQLDIENIPESEWADEKWNTYRLKEVILETVSDAAEAAMKNISDDLTSEIYQHVSQSVAANKELKDPLLDPADSGLKAAAAGAVRAAADKSIIAELPKETETDVITEVASLAVENANVLAQIGNGKLSSSEGLAKIKNNYIATIAGMFGEERGAAIGALIGAMFGPVGTAVGGFIGKVLGRFAGEKLAEAAPAIFDKMRCMAKIAAEKTSNTAAGIGKKILDFFKQF